MSAETVGAGAGCELSPPGGVSACNERGRLLLFRVQVSTRFLEVRLSCLPPSLHYSTTSRLVFSRLAVLVRFAQNIEALELRCRRGSSRCGRD